MDPAPPQPARLIPYADDVIRVLGECQGLAFCELTVPPRFAGPPAHIHHDFDEAIYVLTGALTMTRGQSGPEPASAGTLILAPRGIRHTFANPTDEPVQVLGAWSPSSALNFMEEIGAALPAPDHQIQPSSRKSTAATTAKSSPDRPARSERLRRRPDLHRSLSG